MSIGPHQLPTPTGGSYSARPATKAQASRVTLRSDQEMLRNRAAAISAAVEGDMSYAEHIQDLQSFAGSLTRILQLHLRRHYQATVGSAVHGKSRADTSSRLQSAMRGTVASRGSTRGASDSRIGARGSESLDEARLQAANLAAAKAGEEATARASAAAVASSASEAALLAELEALPEAEREEFRHEIATLRRQASHVRKAEAETVGRQRKAAREIAELERRNAELLALLSSATSLVTAGTPHGSPASTGPTTFEGRHASEKSPPILAPGCRLQTPKTHNITNTEAELLSSELERALNANNMLHAVSAMLMRTASNAVIRERRDMQIEADAAETIKAIKSLRQTPKNSTRTTPRAAFESDTAALAAIHEVSSSSDDDGDAEDNIQGGRDGDDMDDFETTLRNATDIPKRRRKSIHKQRGRKASDIKLRSIVKDNEHAAAIVGDDAAHIRSAKYERDGQLAVDDPAWWDDVDPVAALEAQEALYGLNAAQQESPHVPRPSQLAPTGASSKVLPVVETIRRCEITGSLG
jgi:hypothetical protein